MKNSISSRLAGMVLGTFLPVNLLAILVCSIIINQSSRQVQESFQRELDTGMNQLVLDLDQLEERFSGFLLNYMTELTLEQGNNSLITLEMLAELHDVWENSGRSGMVYLYDKESGRLYLKYTPSAYGIMQIEEVKAALQESIADGGDGASDAVEGAADAVDGAGEGVEGWRLAPISQGWFFSRQFEYTNYYAGFLLDLEKYLSAPGASQLWSRNQVYLQSGGDFFTFQHGRIRFCEADSWEELLPKWYFGRSVRWSAEEVDLEIGIRMVDDRFRVGIPVLYWVLLVVAVCSVFLAVGMWQGLKRRVVKALRVMQRGMQELEQENLEYRIVNWDRRETEEFVFLYNSFNHMAEEIGLSREKDAKMYQAQLDNLRLQVNPHMLLNSFNMIYSLAQSRNFQCIQEYSLLLVEYFRYALKETDRFVPLKKEMDFVENYVSIQKIRFPGAFTSVYRIDPECMEALVPPLLIENFVENAMKYALIPGTAVEVLINIRREEEHLLISVCDTGRGIKPEILDCLQRGEVYRDKMGKEHIGVWNCRRRMEVFYGEEASMKITSSQGQGTQVWLDIPFLRGTEEVSLRQDFGAEKGSEEPGGMTG